MATVVVTRSYSVELLQKAILTYPFETLELDAAAWLAETDKAIMLTDEKGNVACFELFNDKSYDGHYFYSTARGREAINLSLLCLDWMKDNVDAKVIRGFTKPEHKAACLMSKWLGFKNLGLVETDLGPHILFYKYLGDA